MHVSDAYTRPAEDILREVGSSREGLSGEQAQKRLEEVGPNELPHAEPVTLFGVFVRQFLSPLIYVLAVAATVSAFLGEWADAGFILAVLVLNAIIGTIQEFNAERSAEALSEVLQLQAWVIRDGEEREIPAREVVPGDVVLLESGTKVPADLRLFSESNCEIDESLLTGESVAVAKDAGAVLEADTALGERENMAFAGALVTRGRARGVVVGTGLETQIGEIASSVLGGEPTKPPLIVRMERFTKRIALAALVVIALIATIEFARGATLHELFVVSVALAVSAIPEGLPVALTVALAIGVSRMAKRSVIVRKLVAVEALGSCTYIASDKTGTLTLNQLTVRRVALPGSETIEVGGEGISGGGQLSLHDKQLHGKARSRAEALALAGVLCNEGHFGRRGEEWTAHGDAVDVALLALGYKLGMSRSGCEDECPLQGQIPFESDRQYAASLNEREGKPTAFVKGALERVLEMSTTMAAEDGTELIDQEQIEQQGRELAEAGYKVIALAAGELEGIDPKDFSHEHLRELEFLGLVGIIDPLRPEARAAVERCHRAGIEVAMVTGDHPLTALAISRELGLAEAMDQVVTGSELREAAAQGEDALDHLVTGARVFARVEPTQKHEIVTALRRIGHFVAVTGDGANDAPAMRAANVAVAMGERGTDVARESADLILTDDNFASIVAGIEEGRIAYNNVRKVIYLLIATGGAEILLFILATTAGLAPPLLAVQLLWLNLVTNGIQDVALAFEPGEGDELSQHPRPPTEGVFNKIMIERCLLSALIVGGVAFGHFQWLMHEGWELEQARNSVLLLMVLFENVMVGNARSELRSGLTQNPMRNPLLLVGTVGAQLIHIGAAFVPGLNSILHLHPVPLSHWFYLLGWALTVFVGMEIYKFVRRRSLKPAQ